MICIILSQSTFETKPHDLILFNFWTSTSSSNTYSPAPWNCLSCISFAFVCSCSFDQHCSTGHWKWPMMCHGHKTCVMQYGFHMSPDVSMWEEIKRNGQRRFLQMPTVNFCTCTVNGETCTRFIFPIKSIQKLVCRASKMPTVGVSCLFYWLS